MAGFNEFKYGGMQPCATGASALQRGKTFSKYYKPDYGMTCLTNYVTSNSTDCANFIHRYDPNLSDALVNIVARHN